VNVVLDTQTLVHISWRRPRLWCHVFFFSALQS